MASIAENIRSLKNSLPGNVTLVAVSKTKPVASIMEAYNAGHRVFGENRVQEITEKCPALPPDLEMHMIGHLQTNKVKYIIDKVALIEGVDSARLLEVINREAAKRNIVARVLLQVHIADEETKFGFDLEELIKLHSSNTIAEFESVEVCGVMGMATFTDDIEKIRGEFRYLKECFNQLRDGWYTGKPNFKEISMGMSGDYMVAIEEGSTMIRVGSAIFGERMCRVGE